MGFVARYAAERPHLGVGAFILPWDIGIDRFYVGNVGLGLLKLLTAGLGGLWTFIDWFLIMRAARNANCRALERYVE